MWQASSGLVVVSSVVERMACSTSSGAVFDLSHERQLDSLVPRAIASTTLTFACDDSTVVPCTCYPIPQEAALESSYTEDYDR